MEENVTVTAWEDLADNLSTISNMIDEGADQKDLKDIVENYRKLYDLMIQETKNRNDFDLHRDELELKAKQLDFENQKLIDVTLRELELKEQQLEFDKQKALADNDIQTKANEIEERKIKAEYWKTGLTLAGTALSIAAWIGISIKTMFFEESGHVIRSKAWAGNMPKKF